MSNYSKTTDFAAKDSLPSGDAAKIIRGSEFETEFDNISIAIATKADSASPTFTGTVTIDGLTVNGNTTLGNAATDTVTVTADIASNLIPSADNTHDLGASGAEWKDLYVDGVAYIDTVAGFATTENITFGDGDKAIFGASSDLQIYHSGTASHITENGSGSLFIDGTNLRLRSSAEEIYLEALSDGAVTLYYNNAAKLATTSLGIDITGTAEVDALSINGTTVTSTATELNLLDGITGILDEDNMASNSATALATQQSIKAYVDTQVATADALSEVLGNGNTTGGTDIAVGTGDDITFADNSKAIFGAGSDLQIYHDSANSLIEDSGTGNLLIRGSSNVDIQPSGGGSYMARFTASGAASLYHSGSSKLATTSTGIDVTGTLTADGLTVNSGTTNTTSFFESTDATADIIVADTNTSNVLRTNSGGLFINTGGTASTQGTGATPTAQFATNGDVTLYEDTGSTAKFYWDASEESLGLGTSSPSATLDVEAGNEAVAIFNRTASGGSSVGSVVEIQRTGTLAGHLGSQANGYFYVGQSATNLAFSDTNNLIFPRGTDGAARDGEINLGNSSNRFKDFYLSGGVYVGGTAAANKLDDYEEGSWTPVLSDGTNTVTLDTKAYTKVGRMVTCTISTYNKDTSSLSGNIKITGLPFQGLNTDQSVPLYWRDGGDAGDSVFGYLSANSTELNVRENRGSAASATNIAATSTTTIFVTFTYQAS